MGVVVGGLSLMVTAGSAGQDLSPQEQVVALKISLAASQAVLRQHEWIETTTVRLKGEEKARFQSRCQRVVRHGTTSVLVDR